MNPTRKVIFGSEAREKIKKGVDILADAVKSTLGPCGRNVIYEKSFTTPAVTKDGVTVAKEIILEDKLEDMGAQMVKDVASKTADIAGDGTTTATVLAQAIYREGHKYLAAEMNPIEIKRQIDKAVIEVIDEIKTHVKPIQDRTEIEQIATLSANSDEDIGKLIADALEKVGKEGIVTIEDAQGMKDELEVVEGIRIDRGYLSQYFITNVEKAEVQFNAPLILIHDQKITSIKPLVPLLEAVSRVNRSLLIIADEVESDALAPMVMNKLRNAISLSIVKAPSFGNQRKALLEDLAIFTGGTFIDTDAGMSLEDIQVEQLGKCQKVIQTKDNTTIIKGEGNHDALHERIAQLRTMIKDTTSEYDREKYKERLAQLTGGAAIIRVGGITEVEMKERKDRVEDALSATRAAIEEGTIIGGGAAYLRAAQALFTKKGLPSGAEIIRKALAEPFAIIAKNGGYSPEVISAEVLKNKGYQWGFDARTGKFVNMYAAGIIDPFKVTRTALQHAASIAGLLLTTEVAIYKKEEKTEKPLMSQVPGGMY